MKEKRATKRKWWDDYENSLPSQIILNMFLQQRPDEFRRGVECVYFLSKFFLFKLIPGTFQMGERHGREGGKLCIYFYYLTREKIFFISQHTWFADSRFLFALVGLYTLSEPAVARQRKEECIVNEPSAKWWWNFIIFLPFFQGCWLNVLLNNVQNHLIV